MSDAMNWETFPARRFVVVGYNDESKPYYLSTQASRNQGFAPHTTREWSPHLNDATLYVTPDGAEKAMYDVQYSNKKRLPKPLNGLEVRRLSFVVGDTVATVKQEERPA